MKYKNPEIPEGINATETNSLKEFLLLSLGVFAVISVLTVVFVFVIDEATKYVPFEYEVELSNVIIEKFDNKTTVIDAYLQLISNKITPVMALPKDIKLTLHYVNEDKVNAMAILGGHIFIYRGMLEKLPNENALMMLLAHEIAHIKMRHPIKALSKFVAISLLYHSILGGSSDSVKKLITDSSMLTMLSFSRQQEEDADKQALKALYKYNHHTEGSIELFQVLQDELLKSDDASVAFFSSHPDVKKRIDYIVSMAKKNSWKTSGKVRPIPAYIIENMQLDKETIYE